MADIERWITMNGARIPIIKGESRARAVANFIKSKRNKAWSKKYKELQHTTDDLNERAAHGGADIDTATRYIKSKYPSVKGYSTDPYQKERKANKAYSETYKTFDKFVEDNENNYKQIRDENQKRMGVAREQLRKKYPNYMKNDLDYAKYQNEHRLKESEARYKETLADSKIRNAVALRELESRASYMDELNREYSGYKLKAGKETPAKRNIKGVGKTSRMEAADKKYDEAYNALRKIEKGRNSDYKYLTAREYGELSERAGRKLDNAFANYERATTFNTKTPSASMTKTRLGNNAGVRVDGRIYKKITRGNQKGWYMDEGGLKFSPADMSQKISKAKTTRYYKKWSN